MVPPPPKASRTLADVAAFVEAEGIAADAAYTEALNAAQAQEGHQVRWEGGGLKNPVLPEGRGLSHLAEKENLMWLAFVLLCRSFGRS